MNDDILRVSSTLYADGALSRRKFMKRAVAAGISLAAARAFVDAISASAKPFGTPPGQAIYGYLPPGQAIYGYLPPGQGGTPPGLSTLPPGLGGTPPGQGGTPPGSNTPPPGLGGTPPGQGGTPPGRGKRF